MVRDLEAARSRALATRSLARVAFNAAAGQLHRRISTATVTERWRNRRRKRAALGTFRTRALDDRCPDRAGRRARPVPGYPAPGSVTLQNSRVDFDSRGLTTPLGISGVVYLRSTADPSATRRGLDQRRRGYSDVGVPREESGNEPRAGEHEASPSSRCCWPSRCSRSGWWRSPARRRCSPRPRAASRAARWPSPSRPPTSSSSAVGTRGPSSPRRRSRWTATGSRAATGPYRRSTIVTLDQGNLVRLRVLVDYPRGPVTDRAHDPHLPADLMSTSRARSRAGFTLLELILALTHRAGGAHHRDGPDRGDLAERSGRRPSATTSPVAPATSVSRFSATSRRREWTWPRRWTSERSRYGTTPSPSCGYPTIRRLPASIRSARPTSRPACAA